MLSGAEAAGEAVPSKTPTRLLRGLVIGQAPPGPPETLPLGYEPLNGLPERRLAKLAGFRSPEEFWGVFDRVDLLGWCPGPKPRKEYHQDRKVYKKHNWDGHKFPTHLARLAAGRLLNFGGPFGGGTSLRDYSVVVLCGRHVASAFGLKLQNVPWAEESGGVRYLVMPHPSGVSHLWNEPFFHHRAAAAFRAAVEVAGLSPPRLASVKKEPSPSLLAQPLVLIKEEPRSSSSAQECSTLVTTAHLASSSSSSSTDGLRESCNASTTIAASSSEGLPVAMVICPPNPSEDVIHSRFFTNTCGRERIAEQMHVVYA